VTMDYGDISILEASLSRQWISREYDCIDLQIWERLFSLGATACCYRGHGQRAIQPEKCIMTLLIQCGADDSLIFKAFHAGADLNCIATAVEFDESPLMAALMRGRFRLADELIKRGADVNHNASVRPLFVAASHIHQHGRSFVKYLVIAGADVNGTSRRVGGMTALHGSASSGALENVAFLLECGADIQATAYGSTPLDLAAANGRLETCRLLMEAGGKSARSGKTGYDGAMDQASADGHHAIVKMIQEFIAEKGARSQEGGDGRT
jgi:hypothetical protein